MRSENGITLEVDVFIDDPKHCSGLCFMQILQQKVIGILPKGLTTSLAAHEEMNRALSNLILLAITKERIYGCYLTYLDVNFTQPKRTSKFHLLIKETTTDNENKKG